MKTVTQLDFDELKSEIISYIKNNPAFSDYNFEGSALNAIIDILTYNTHNNAYYANMIHNEGFLDSAQKRSSVVSRAKELGYVPMSAKCSTAYVDINLYGASSNSGYIQMKRGTPFTSKNDNGIFTFYSVDDAYSSSDGNFSFKNIRLSNGYPTKNSFIVNTQSNLRSIFTIPNRDVDVSTLKVFVRESISSIGRTEYYRSNNVYELVSNSRSYFLQESYDGFFQIYFGSDVLGIQPSNGNVIDIDYFVVEAFKDSNLSSNFYYDGVMGNADSVGIVTKQIAFGGDIKESIDSIKNNAIKSNSAKNRSVTVNDYELLLKQNFGFIKSVSVWGGEINSPPVYGKVFISIQPHLGFVVSDSIKKDIILPVIKSNSILTIVPEFVDPSFICMDFVTKIKFNPQKTLSSQVSVESSIINSVSEYIDSISFFNLDYLESSLSTMILMNDPGIISIDIDKRVGFRLTPPIGIETSFNKSIGNKVILGSISSNKFNVSNDGIQSIVSIKEVIGKTSTIFNSERKYETIQNIGLYDNNGFLVKEVGTVNLDSGEFNFSINIYSYPTDVRAISLRCEMINDDMYIKRNNILIIDKEIPDSNKVLTEIYAK